MTITPVGVIVGAAIPLLRANVDTDVIIRVDRMVSMDPVLLAPYAFEALRHRVDGTIDPTCALNDPRFQGAPTLIAGANFGCGSSREPAVRAIAGLGIRCIIAPKLRRHLPGQLLPEWRPPDRSRRNRRRNARGNAADGTPVRIDLPAQTVTSLDDTWRFTIAQLQKTALVEGLDDLDLSIRHLDAVRMWEARDTTSRPWVWSTSISDGGSP